MNLSGLVSVTDPKETKQDKSDDVVSAGAALLDETKSPFQLTTASSNKVKVSAYNHGLYDESSNVQISGVVGDRVGSVIEVGSPSISGSPSDGNYNAQTANSTNGSGTGMIINVEIASGAIGTTNGIRIVNPGQGYAAGDTVTFDNFDGGTADLTITVVTISDTLGGIPVGAINTTFGSSSTNGVANIGIDSFNVACNLTSFIGVSKFVSGYTALETTTGGGSAVQVSRNYIFDSLHTMIPSTQVGSCKVVSSINTTAMKSPEGFISSGDTVYNRRTTNNFITLNDNTFLDAPGIVASPINETNKMQSQRSFRLITQMLSRNPNISPVIDVGTIGCIAISNRINNIDSQSGKKVDGTTVSLPSDITHIPSTEPEGDQNAFIYVTRKVNLKNPATSIKVIADNFRPPTTELKYMFKIVKSDEQTPLDDLGFEFFNTDGSPDKAVENDARNFKEYEYTVNDLPEFSSFIIKIVGQGQNSSVVPMVSALRVMALA